MPKYQAKLSQFYPTDSRIERCRANDKDRRDKITNFRSSPKDIYLLDSPTNFRRIEVAAIMGPVSCNGCILRCSDAFVAISESSAEKALDGHRHSPKAASESELTKKAEESIQNAVSTSVLIEISRAANLIANMPSLTAEDILSEPDK